MFIQTLEENKSTSSIHVKEIIDKKIYKVALGYTAHDTDLAVSFDRQLQYIFLVERMLDIYSVSIHFDYNTTLCLASLHSFNGDKEV